MPVRAWRVGHGEKYQALLIARAGVLVSFLSPSHASFRCILLPPILIPASALRSVAKVWVAARHGGVLPLSLISEQLVEPCFGHRSPLQTHPRHRTLRQGLTPLSAALLRALCLDAEVLLSKWKVSQSGNSSCQRSRKDRNIALLMSSSPPGDVSHRCARSTVEAGSCGRRCQ